MAGLCRRASPTTASSAESRPSSSARASSGSSKSRAQNVWTNDRNFNELGNERDPIIGAHDGTLEFKDSQAAHSQEDRRPACLHHAEGRRVLLSPGHQGAWPSRIIERTRRSVKPRKRTKRENPMSAPAYRSDLQSGSHCAQIHGRQAADKHLLTRPSRGKRSATQRRWRTASSP